jgi:uncharacterized protein YqgQ
MDKMLDIYQLLKQYGTFIYTGDRFGDLQLMEEEIKELYKGHVLDVKQYQTALLVIRQEVARLEAEKK